MAVPTPDVYGDTIRLDAPTLWYRFDSAALLTDSATTPLSGVAGLGAGTATAALTGDRTANEAINLSGTNQSFTVAANAKHNYIDNFTLEFWISADAFLTGGFPSGVQYIIDKSNAAFSQGWGISLWDGAITGYTASTAGFANCFTGIVLTPGKTFHVVMTYSALILKMYVNGILVSSTKAAAALTAADGALFVGRRSGSTDVGPYLDGRLDEFAVYNKVLTDADVWRHYTIGKDALTLDAVNDLYSRAVLRDDPMGWVRFDGGLAFDAMGDPVAAVAPTLVATPTFGASIIPADPGVQALVLNGTTQYATVPALAKWDVVGGFSVECWVNLSSITGTRTIISRAGDYTLKVINGVVTATVVTTSGTFTASNTANPLVAGTAYHLVLTYREHGFWGSGLNVYVNANMSGETAIPAADTHTADARIMHVGSLGGTTEFFAGSIADIAYYKYVLTSRRVKEHYQKGAKNYYPMILGSFIENLDFEAVALPLGPEWERLRASWKGLPIYENTWDGKIVLGAVGAANGAANILFKSENISPDRDWDLSFWVLADLANDQMFSVHFQADGQYHKDNTWAPRNGYSLRFVRNATGPVATVEARKYVNDVETSLGAPVTVSASLWNAGMWVRAQCRSGVIRWKLFADGVVEPIPWDATVTDASPLTTPGWTGVGSMTQSDGAQRNTYFDNFIIVRGRGMRSYRVRGGVEVPIDPGRIAGGFERQIRTSYPPSKVVAQDTFDRANNAALVAAGTGQAWTNLVGTTTIASNRADPTTATAIATLDCADTDFDLSADVVYKVANPVTAGVVFHVIDATNYYSWHSTGTTLVLTRTDAGVVTTLATVTGQSFAVNDVRTLRVVSSGAMIQCWHQGTMLADYQMTQNEVTKFKVNRIVGLRVGTITVASFDNFIVKRTTGSG